MRFPDFNPPNIPQKPEGEAKYLSVEDNIALIKRKIEEAKKKYEQTKDVTDKINLVEAETQLAFLEEELDLDFTKPGAVEGIEVKEDHSTVEEKIEELKGKIASAERGIKLAKSLNDSVRTEEMLKKKEEFEQTLAILTTPKNQKAVAEVDGSAYDSDFEAEKSRSQQKRSEAFRKEHGIF